MADGTGIEWTDSTWNPIVGCSVVSPGCTHCYAMGVAGGRAKGTPKYEGLTKPSKGGAVWTGDVRFWEKELLQPLRWKRPRKIFVNSMGDLFHENVPDEWIDRVFAVMALAPQHTFQVLTKRAARMRDYVAEVCRTPARYTRWAAIGARLMSEVGLEDSKGDSPPPWPLPNVWLGVSAEDQVRADERIPLLLQTPSAVRFISAEPLLGPIDLSPYVTAINGIPGTCFSIDHERWHALGGCRHCQPALDWVIVGGESGRKARPMSGRWAIEIRDSCIASGVAFFFKQWGEWTRAVPRPSGTLGRYAFGDYEFDKSDRAAWHIVDAYPRQFDKFGARAVVERVGKKAGGRLLDGRTWDEFPGANAHA